MGYHFIVAVRVDSKEIQPSRRTQKREKPFRSDVSLLSRQLVCFLFLSFLLITWFFICFFLSFPLSFFLSLQIRTKNTSALPFSSFFRSSFFHLIFPFIKDYNKNRQRPRLPIFLSFLNIMYTDAQMYTQNATLAFYIIRRLRHYYNSKRWRVLFLFFLDT